MSQRRDTSRVTSEEKIQAGKDQDQDYARSVAATKLLLKRINELLDSRQQLAVFSADRFEPQSSDLEEMCEDLGIPFVPFPNEAFMRAKDQAEVFAHDGYHWNEFGHQVVGEELAKRLPFSIDFGPVAKEAADSPATGAR